MACIKRLNTGACTHHQCPHSVDTGVECVDILTAADCSELGLPPWLDGKCELGEGCVPSCPYAYPKEERNR